MVAAQDPAGMGGNLMILKAIQIARLGNILVVDGCGDQTTGAIIGGIMRAMALKAEIANNGRLTETIV